MTREATFFTTGAEISLQTLNVGKTVMLYDIKNTFRSLGALLARIHASESQHQQTLLYVIS